MTGNSFLPANVLVPTQNSGDRNLTYVGSLRGGYWVGPSIYIFAEGGADLRRYRIPCSIRMAITRSPV